MMQFARVLYESSMCWYVSSYICACAHVVSVTLEVCVVRLLAKSNQQCIYTRLSKCTSVTASYSGTCIIYTMIIKYIFPLPMHTCINV